MLIRGYTVVLFMWPIQPICFS